MRSLLGVWCLRRLPRVRPTWQSFEARTWSSARIWDLCIHVVEEFLRALKDAKDFTFWTCPHFHVFSLCFAVAPCSLYRVAQSTLPTPQASLRAQNVSMVAEPCFDRASRPWVSVFCVARHVQGPRLVQRSNLLRGRRQRKKPSVE